jgi:hypothetical protein
MRRWWILTVGRYALATRSKSDQSSRMDRSAIADKHLIRLHFQEKTGADRAYRKREHDRRAVPPSWAPETAKVCS